jgi:uncharacterized membrane-anchored protein YhcB (DUF1043 family)
MTGWQILNSVLGIAVGVFVAIVVSRFFHRRTSKDLRLQADRLKTQVDKVLAALEEADLVDLVRKNGEITGIVKYGKVGPTPEDC